MVSVIPAGGLDQEHAESRCPSLSLAAPYRMACCSDSALSRRSECLEFGAVLAVREAIDGARDTFSKLCVLGQTVGAGYVPGSIDARGVLLIYLSKLFETFTAV